MKNWPLIFWEVFISMLILIACIFLALFSYYKHAHVLKEYAIWSICLISFFYYMSRGCKDVHIHHYTVAMILLSFSAYQNVFVTAIAGVVNGIMIEGGSFWGYDPIFLHEDSEDKIKALKALEKSQIKIEN